MQYLIYISIWCNYICSLDFLQFIILSLITGIDIGNILLFFFHQFLEPFDDIKAKCNRKAAYKIIKEIAQECRICSLLLCQLTAHFHKYYFNYLRFFLDNKIKFHCDNAFSFFLASKNQQYFLWLSPCLLFQFWCFNCHF